MTKSDLRLLKLYRKAVHQPKATNTEGTSTLALATDYFDAMEVQEVPFKYALRDMIGTEDDLHITKYDVSMQSYPLYCPSETIKKHKNDDKYRNPFDNNERLTYLSIIQVYITPETIARIHFEKKQDSLDVLDVISEDLHTIINDYASISKRSFYYRVYQTISVGDFAIVINSKEADVPFCISTIIRKRRMISNPIDNKKYTSANIVLYKTYTILSINNTLIKGDIVSKAKDSRFVLRCCYSNKYWSHRTLSVNSELAKYEAKINGRLKRLNGRYDFSVDLSDERFIAIFSDLRHYKLDISYEVDAELFNGYDSDKYDEADYLHYLLTQGYVSHINERYVFKFTDTMDEISSEAVGISAELQNNPSAFLEQKNEELIEKTLKDFNDVYKAVLSIQDKGYRKNLQYNMVLLNRLIYLCDTINGLSDTRIYCSLLLRQIISVITGVKNYCFNISNNIKGAWDRLDSDLKGSIYALNSYAEYIRNNNLQSLQTPNYNLESSVSIEKYLIGYSYLLDKILSNYSSSKVFNSPDKKKSSFSALIPVMIPQAENASLTIKVMFPQISMVEESIHSKLMVVECPSIRELINVPEIVATLFHEVAHQFRYESREYRNKEIMKYCISILFDKSALDISNSLRRELPSVSMTQDICPDINNAMRDAYLSVAYPDYVSADKSQINMLELPLTLLCGKLRSDFEHFLKDGEEIERVSSYIKGFAERIKAYIDINEVAIRDALINLGEFESKILTISNDRLDAYLECVEECIRFLLDSVKSKSKPDNSDQSIEDQAKAIIDLLGSIKGNISNRVTFVRMRDSFYHKFYDLSCNLYSNHSNEAVLSDHLFTIDQSIGRFLCIDYPSPANEYIFTKYVSDFVVQSFIESIVNMDSAVKDYREQTSDLFMVNMMRLSPYGYLYMMVRNLMIDTEPKEVYLKRITIVMYVIWGNRTNINGCLESVWSIAQQAIADMLLHYITYYINISPQMSNVFRIGLKELNNGEIKDEQLSQNITLTIKVLQNVRVKLFDFESGIDANYDDSVHAKIGTDITHQIHLLEYLEELVMSSNKFIEQLERNDYLYEDLDRGKSAISEWSDEWQSKNDKIFNFCLKAARFFNDPTLRYHEESFEDFNEEMIQFVQCLFYGFKFEMGRSVGQEMDSVNGYQES